MQNLKPFGPAVWEIWPKTWAMGGGISAKIGEDRRRRRGTGEASEVKRRCSRLGIDLVHVDIAAHDDWGRNERAIEL